MINAILSITVEARHRGGGQEGKEMNEPARCHMHRKCCAEEADTGAGHKQSEK